MIDFTQLGTVQPDGSILLSNNNINFREQMSGNYERVRQTPEQNFQLDKWGYTQVQSSFISGIGQFGDDLRIRFHNGSVYEYYNMASKFDAIMRANSKGQYFNRHIRPTKNYAKIDNLDFERGNTKNLSDTQVFDMLETQTMANMLKMLGGLNMVVKTVKIEGIEHYKLTIGDLIMYRPIIKSVN